MALNESLRNAFFHKYKKILIIPLIVLVASLFIIFSHYAETGQFLDKQVSLSGGSTATISSQSLPSLTEIESKLKGKLPDLSVRLLTEFGSDSPLGVTIETSSEDQTLLKESIEQALNIQLNEDNFSLQVVGSSLGKTFYKQMMRALIFAFLFMAIVVFIMFRSPIPCLTVVLGAVADILTTIAMLNLLDVKVSTAGIASLLLLIGYSIDTDVLLTNRALKRKENSLEDNTISAMKTGLTMTITSLVASLVGLLLSTSPVLKEIFLILTIGLVADIFFTWLMNAPLVFWYLSSKRVSE